MVMPTHHTPAGCSPVGCQQHLPAPSRGWQTKRQGQRGDLGIPLVWSLCVCSLLLPPKPGTNQPAAFAPAAGMAPIAGHGVTEAFGGPTKVPTGSIGKPPARHGQTCWTPLPSCQLGFELLLRLKFPPSPCLHPKAGGCASS